MSVSIAKSLNAASGVLKRFGEFIGKHKPDTKVAVGIIGNAYAMYLVYKRRLKSRKDSRKRIIFLSQRLLRLLF